MFCFPECRECVSAGKCEKQIAFARAHPRSRNANWAPNTLEMVELPCGCVDIPWPIIYNFTDSIIEILCDKHGVQKITKEQKKRWKRIIKDMKFEPMDRLFDAT